MRPIRYRSYLLTILMIIYALTNADRLAVGVALQDMKAALHLSDTQLGLLTGIAFAAFYALMGIPIGRWADRGNRVKLVGLTMTLWSVTVLLTGRALNFAQLLLARIGVAVGEAGPLPAAQSLIPDYFTRAERPLASALLMTGWPLALLIGYFLAGWLNEIYGWRLMFLIIGLPGFVIAAISWPTLREPRFDASARGKSPEGGEQSAGERVEAKFGERTACLSATVAEPPGLIAVFITLWRNATYRHLLMCYVVASFFGTGMLQWQPAFFMRSFGMSSGQVGTGLAIMLGAGSLLSIYVGGAMASRYAANNERLQLQVAALAYLLFGLDHAIAYLSPNAYLAFVLVGSGALINAIGGPLFAAIQTLVPARMRGTSYAILFFLSNLVGLGLGPLATGALSEALHPMLGRESLRYALLAMCPGYAWSAWQMWRASTTVMHDLAEVREHRMSEPAPDCL